MVSLLPACIWVLLCPSSSHHTGAANWSVVCHLQHQVPSSRCAGFLHYWEKVVADLWGSQGVFDPCVFGAVLMCIQTLLLPRARWDSECVRNDQEDLREVAGPGGGVHARKKRVLSKPESIRYQATIILIKPTCHIHTNTWYIHTCVFWKPQRNCVMVDIILMYVLPRAHHM